MSRLALRQRFDSEIGCPVYRAVSLTMSAAVGIEEVDLKDTSQRVALGRRLSGLHGPSPSREVPGAVSHQGMEGDRRLVYANVRSSCTHSPYPGLSGGSSNDGDEHDRAASHRR